jgi:hypothetical protein
MLYITIRDFAGSMLQATTKDNFAMGEKFVLLIQTDYVFQYTPMRRHNAYMASYPAELEGRADLPTWPSLQEFATSPESLFQDSRKTVVSIEF